MLKLNQDKTELIVFAPKQQVKQLSNFQLTFDGTVLTDVSCVKNLGFFLTKHSVWNIKLVQLQNHVSIRYAISVVLDL